MLLVDGLEIPWSRDCAGVNVLALLLIIALWAHRRERWNGLFWAGLASVFPLALASNVACVLTIVGYRKAFFPAVETPQTHYLISFLWLIPAVALVIPRRAAGERGMLIETLYSGIILAWMASMLDAAGGVFLVGSAILLLFSRHFVMNVIPPYLIAVWILAGAGIALASMESLWLPWLLCCPWFAPRAWWRQPSQIVLLLATVPLFSMQRFAPWIALPFVFLEANRLRKGSNADSNAAVVSTPLPLQFALGLVLLAPFATAAIGSLSSKPEMLPGSAQIECFAAQSYHVRLPSQPAQLQFVWFNPQGGGRHHTLAVCMRYRGIELKPVAGRSAVLTDGKHWMREFFVVRSDLVSSYGAYLLRTILPFTPTGAHLIVSAPQGAMDAAAFEDAAAALAKRAVASPERAFQRDNTSASTLSLHRARTAD